MILDRTKEFRSSTTATTAIATIASTAAVADVTKPQEVESAVLGGEVPTHEQQVSSRYLGLVVVPGDVIVRLEVEEKRGGDA